MIKIRKSCIQGGCNPLDESFGNERIEILCCDTDKCNGSSGDSSEPKDFFSLLKFLFQKLLEFFVKLFS